MPDSSPTTNSVVKSSPWSQRTKVVVSLLLLWHLLAQFLATWNAAPPTSLLGRTAMLPFGPYIQFAKLDQGYRFFAPDPGPSHLLEFQVLDVQGKPLPLPEFALPSDPTVGRLPPADWRVSLFSPRARLLYHRYFMLTEQLDGYDPIHEAQGSPLAIAKQRSFDAIMDSYARELLRRYGGQSVRLKNILHTIPKPNEVQQGLELDHPRLYVARPPGELIYPRAIGPQVSERFPLPALQP